MAFTAADVGPRIDVLIDGQGYIFDDTLDSGSVYSQHQRAELGLSPVFVERQNVQGNYGDNQQDFWLTFSQKDWSLGEQQRYARPNDDTAASRYWTGTNIDVRTLPGQASIREAVSTLTFAATALNVTARAASSDTVIFATSTKLYAINNAGTITDNGLHGLGNSPQTIALDPTFTYISTTAAGTVGVRSFGAVYATFSATASNLLAFLNNTLYGFRNTTNDLIRYDSAGAVTSIFTWKSADGAAAGSSVRWMFPFGGKLLLLLYGPERWELWQYDGVAPAKIAELPSNFAPKDVAISEGTLFVSGIISRKSTSKPTIWYYANGTDGILWKANSYASSITECQVGAFDGGLVFTDDTNLKLMFYDLATGGVSTLGSYSATGGGGGIAAKIAAAGTFFVYAQGTTTGYLYPSATYATTATVSTSLVDFDSSLDKLFRGIKVDFDAGTDGNGGTVDIAYRLNDVNSSYTSLQTGATSGTEYSLSGITGRSISVKVTLNKGTSTSGPVLKRISVRGAPVQPQYARASYALACYGSPGPPSSDEETRVELRDGTSHVKSGGEMVADLKTAAAKSSISITDEVNGTFTGVIEADQLRFHRHRPGEWRAFVTVRQI